MMERVLFNLHSKASSFALRNTSARTRSLLEHCVLLVAVFGFGALILSHLSFVHVGDRSNEFDASRPLQSRHISMSCLKSIPDFQKEASVTHIVLTDGKETSCFLPDIDPPGLFLSFSKTKGFLLLSQMERSHHNITTQVITIPKSDPQCFGEPFLQAIVFNLIGPETVAINWLLAVYNQRGYVYNQKTNSIIDLNNSSSDSLLVRHSYHRLVFKLGVILTSLFLFFITTTLVSFTLRETQDRMLEFTFQLQARIRARLPHGQLIFTHVIESLVFVPVMVGMMFFLNEFYGGDKFLAFMVLSLVWICEVFSVVGIRTTQGMNFFPRIFFLLFTLFHIYFFSFPFGFSYTALASTSCFMVHSMLFFWNRFELPAVAHGLVTADHPRMVRAPHAHRHEHPAAQPVLENDQLDAPQRHPLTMRRHNSAHSFPSVSSAGRGSALFNDGDDEDESYMYFMGGEVVMYRDRRVSSPSGSIVRGESLGSMSEAATDTVSFGVPQNILAEVAASAASSALSSAVATQNSDHRESLRSEGTTVRRRTPASSRNQLTTVDGEGVSEAQTEPSSPPSTSPDEGDENLTPRWGTAAQQRVQGTAEDSVQTPRAVGAPTFPFFKFGRQ